MNKSFYLLLILGLLIACTKNREEITLSVFFVNYQEFRENPKTERKLIESYLDVSNDLSENYLDEISGTYVNTLCLFMNDFSSAKLTLSPDHNNIISNDFKIIQSYLELLPNAGKMYRECVIPFDLEIDKNWRYK